MRNLRVGVLVWMLLRVLHRLQHLPPHGNNRQSLRWRMKHTPWMARLQLHRRLDESAECVRVPRRRRARRDCALGGATGRRHGK